MAGKVLMVQGTASHVGKSVLVAGLCRMLRQDGLSLAPFKAQNMSNNSYVTVDGGEMGRAQVVQAEAAGIEPTVEMNPILLKPESDRRSQVVVMGRPVGSYRATRYFSSTDDVWGVVCQALDELRSTYDVVVIEGAGSPAEINLRDSDIVNMRVAMYAGARVLLVGDIDRGGVFASLYGTLELLQPEERAIVGATVINKFRGDISLLTPGLTMLEEITGVPVAGVVPYFRDIHIPEEDSVPLEQRRRLKARTDYMLDIAVMGLPHISNFDEFDPLVREAGVRLRYVEAGDVLGTPNMVILPGTKAMVNDLDWLRDKGFAEQLHSLRRGGTVVMGICGGYQMLGQSIMDPDGVESTRRETEGPGLLPLSTVFEGTKETHRVSGVVTSCPGLLEGADGLPFEGYEIHMGRELDHDDGFGWSTLGAPSLRDTSRPFSIVERSGQRVERPDGATDPTGMVLGTYVHGLFHNAELRSAILRRLARWKGVELPRAAVGKEADGIHFQDEQYDKLAALLRDSLDMELVYRLTGLSHV